MFSLTSRNWLGHSTKHYSMLLWYLGVDSIALTLPQMPFSHFDNVGAWICMVNALDAASVFSGTRMSMSWIPLSMPMSPRSRTSTPTFLIQVLLHRPG